MGRLFVHHESELTGTRFLLEVVDVLLATHKPDLLWIDPALSFLGGENNLKGTWAGFSAMA
jgi:hypothetical protein